MFGCFHTNLEGIPSLDSRFEYKAERRLCEVCGFESLSSVLISACRLAAVLLDCNFDAVHTTEAIPRCLARVSCMLISRTFLSLLKHLQPAACPAQTVSSPTRAVLAL